MLTASSFNEKIMEQKYNSRKGQFLLWLGVVLILLMALSLTSTQPVLASSGYAVTQTVTNTNDSGAGSLRQAIANASSGDTILFDPALAGQTITLLTTLTITKDITIDGTGLDPRIEISGGNAVRVFFMDSTIIAIKNLVIRNGKQTGLSYQYYGGAMFVDTNTNLTIQNVFIKDNSAYSAGAIYISPYANLTITESEFSNNSTDTDGSTIYVKSIGTLTLKNSRVSNNTAQGNGAIYFSGATSLSLLENNVFSVNTAASGGAVYAQIGNARIEMYGNLFTGNSSTAPSGGGGALYLWRTSTPTLLILENNTFHNNSAAYRGGAVMFSSSGDVYFNNNTLSDNGASQGGNAFLFGATNFLQNYNNIMANSTSGGDCYLQGSVSSTGSNNLIKDGSATCAPDITGDPGLSVLADHGGPTETMAISSTSIAWDAGNDANCPSKDQRGTLRPQGTHCDIGAYELDETAPSATVNQAEGQEDPTYASPINFTIVFNEPINVGTFAANDISLSDPNGVVTLTEISPNDGTTFNASIAGLTGIGTISASIPENVVEDIAKNLNIASTSSDNSVEYDYVSDITPPVVSSIVRGDTNPTSASSANFVVNFSESVINVDATDFTLATSGVTGTSITDVTGADEIYTVTVNTGNGNGSIRLDLIDDDSILDTSSNPLGGTGSGNGNFTTGESYVLHKVPTAQTPSNVIIDTTPTFKWTKITGATKYQIQLWKGATLVYAKNVTSAACTGATCHSTPTTTLSFGTYKWRVRAMAEGVWMNYSPYKSFKLFPAKPGSWKGQGLEFYVINSTPKVDDFAIYISVTGCGIHKVTHYPLAAISNKRFSFTGSFYANGTFTTPSKAQGMLGLNRFYIDGCGYVTGGPFPWTATWKNGSQPALTLSEGEISEFTISPEFSIPFDILTIDPEK